MAHSLSPVDCMCVFELIKLILLAQSMPSPPHETSKHIMDVHKITKQAKIDARAVTNAKMALGSKD